MPPHRRRAGADVSMPAEPTREADVASDGPGVIQEETRIFRCTTYADVNKVVGTRGPVADRLGVDGERYEAAQKTRQPRVRSPVLSQKLIFLGHSTTRPPR